MKSIEILESQSQHVPEIQKGKFTEVHLSDGCIRGAALLRCEHQAMCHGTKNLHFEAPQM